jgi:hypothetical protein
MEEQRNNFSDHLPQLSFMPSPFTPTFRHKGGWMDATANQQVLAKINTPTPARNQALIVQPTASHYTQLSLSLSSLSSCGSVQWAKWEAVTVVEGIP